MTAGMVRLAALTLVAALAAACPAAGQQPAKVPRVGYLDGSEPSASRHLQGSFRTGLREHGWIDGQNVVIEYRSAEGKPARYAEVANELVRLNVSVIVTAGEPLILAAKQATSTIPIVMAAVGDPVGRGFAASLARPGGNITGVSNLAVELPGKWLELIKEVLPRASRVAVLRNLVNPSHDTFWREAQAGAKALGLSVVSVGMRGPGDLEDAFASATRERATAIVVLPDPITAAHRVQVASLAQKHRLPSVYLFRDNVEAGGLMSYGPNLAHNYRRAADYVDKILRGAKPGELPIEQAREFELVVNLRTAKALGLTPPQSILRRADRVIPSPW